MDIEQMKELIKAVSESDVTSFEYEDEKEKVKIKKGTIKQEIITGQADSPVILAPANPQPAAKEILAQVAGTGSDEGNVVKSPLVGTFYSSASPDAEPFVKVGDHVVKGQVLGIIEAMKLMNDIESDFDGEIVEILVNNKDMVEYDQPLFRIK